MGLLKGVVVASDQNTAWLLPWWWNYYSKYNNYPVLFVDLGLSEKNHHWCRDRGEVVFLDTHEGWLAPKGSVTLKNIEKWESNYLGNLWQARQGWFKKPFACLQTSFELTLWMDIDCEVCVSLDSLFDEWREGIQLALVSDERAAGEVLYSSGVILFRKGAPFLEKWAKLCATCSDQFMGDQNILTELLQRESIPLKQLDPIYNWIMYRGFHWNIQIAHWGAGWGKEYIQKHQGIHSLLERHQKNFL